MYVWSSYHNVSFHFFNKSESKISNKCAMCMQWSICLTKITDAFLFYILLFMFKNRPYTIKTDIIL